ncbi:hypothetical protein JCGZ_16833 [Jatropha curcas]|uniref:Uncharacterized protein n=1 Tax=Jatropha curcas TaxID=180498 RepID=A0A067L4Z7_JATCU|nr:hypothetical protein JCGZ_16833 [Jatropha curcas]
MASQEGNTQNGGSSNIQGGNMQGGSGNIWGGNIHGGNSQVTQAGDTPNMSCGDQTQKLFPHTQLTLPTESQLIG